MKPVHPVFALLVGALSLAGCAAPVQEAAAPKPVATPAPAPLAPQTRQPTLLDRWVAEARTPSAVTCDVDPNEAPNAVARFQALSARVTALYRTIYDDAKRVADGTMPAPEPVPGIDWRTTAQTYITSRYQAAVGDIESARKDLAAYVEAIGDDDAITNSVQRTRLRMRLGQGAARLETLLDDAARAATLMREQGLADTSAK